MILIRPAHPIDWTAIGALANQAVAHLSGNRLQDSWLENRKVFTGSRHHFVAERGEEIIGYCGLEHDGLSEKEWRMFLVQDWSDERHMHLARILFDQLNEKAGQEGILQIWLREYADDSPFIQFMRHQDFEIGDPFTVGDTDVIMMTADGPFGFMSRRSNP